MNVPDVTSEFRFVPGQQEQGFRSVLFVPMVRDAMSIGGKQTIVRQADGVHLNATGSRLAADSVLAAMREDFTGP